MWQYLYWDFDTNNVMNYVVGKIEVTRNILALYRINYPLLAGKWKLMRTRNYNDGNDFVLDFPFDIPDTLLVKEEDFTATFYKDRSFYMLTNGKVGMLPSVVSQVNSVG